MSNPPTIRRNPNGAARASWRFVVGLAASVGVLCGACSSDPSKGYAFGTPFRTDVRTVAVPIFENTTFNHGLEFTLTDAIIKEIHRTTPWRVAPRESADSVLSGTITRADLKKLSTQRETGLVQELAVDMSVNFEWKNNRDGKVLVTRRNFHAAQEFVPAKGAKERLEFGQESTIDQMAKDIVAELRSSW